MDAFRRTPRRLLAALALLGLALTVTVVPGLFTIDEAHQMAMVQAVGRGRVTVAGTEGLKPSRELLYFEPAARGRQVRWTPVAPTVPPLHAPIAAPFLALAGWRGLVAVNTLAFLVAAWVVFAYARRYATRDETAWFATATFAFGGYNLEYAQGVWPHMLAVALVLSALWLTARVRDGATATTAFAAGLLAGLATGVRYQNVVPAFAIGLGLGLAGPTKRRRSNLLAYGAGVALPLLACSAVNHERFGFWSPVSKGPGYETIASGTGSALALEVARALTYRVVHGAIAAGMPDRPWAALDPEVGVELDDGVVKKALLQSSPWIAVALVALCAAWPSGRWTGSEAQRRETRAGGLVVLATLALFGLAGVRRDDGLGYNQRYLLELLPVLALALAWCAEPLLAAWRWLAAGALAGGCGLALALAQWPFGDPLRVRIVAWVPLLLALAALVAFALGRGRGSRIAAGLLGLTLGHAFVVHVADDWVTSRARRAATLERTGELARVIPDRSALFAYWGRKDAAAPLQLSRDLVIVDPRADEGADARELLDQLVASGRRTFVLADGLPGPIGRALLAGRQARPVRAGAQTLLEIVAPSTR